MARVTVEDCLEVVDNQYDLVILAKERTLQIGAGDKPMVPDGPGCAVAAMSRMHAVKPAALSWEI